MAFRKRRHDSDEDSDEERLPLNRDEDDGSMKADPAKKAKNIWSDMLLEEQLLEKGQKINLDRTSRKQPNISRGPESYVMPQDEFQRKQARKKNAIDSGKCDPFQTPVVLVTPACDDLFGDAPGALAEEFGVKKNDAKAAAPEDDGWWGTRGSSARYLETLPREKKPAAPKKTSQLMAEEFSLEKMMAVEFADDIPLEQLGEEIALALGEKSLDTVKKVVLAVGRNVAIKLFNETKEIEQGGGMKTADGSRRRTPGGVYITLFKMDPEVSRETKDGIFGDMRNADKQRSKTKKKAQNFTKKLEDMKKTMDLASKAAEKLETAQNAPFDDEVVDMI